jgi:hypothetical protein
MREAQLAVMMMPPTLESSDDGAVAEAPTTTSFSLPSVSVSASEEGGDVVFVTVTIVLDGRVASTRVNLVDRRSDRIGARRAIFPMQKPSRSPSRDPMMGGALAAGRWVGRRDDGVKFRCVVVVGGHRRRVAADATRWTNESAGGSMVVIVSQGCEEDGDSFQLVLVKY